MSKEYYRKKIIDLRASMQKEKDAKKRDNEHFAQMIKNASSPSSKASFRKQKLIVLHLTIEILNRTNAKLSLLKKV